MIQLDDKNYIGENAIILYPGANYALHEQDIHGIMKEYYNGDWLLLQNESSGTRFALNAARLRGMVIVMNVAPMDLQVLEKYDFNQVDILVMNAVEAEVLMEVLMAFPRKSRASQRMSMISTTSSKGTSFTISDEKDVTQRVREYFPGISGVVVTRGKHGVRANFHGNIYDIPAYPLSDAEVVDSTGAGDTFIGYLAATLAQRGWRPAARMMHMSNPIHSDEEQEQMGMIGVSLGEFDADVVDFALRRASMAAAMSVMTFGAMDGIPLGQDVDSRMQRFEHDMAVNALLQEHD